MFVRVKKDDGIALMMSLSVMAISLVLALVAAKVATSTSQSSGHDRQRVTAIDAAEAGVDQSYALIQSAGTNLPCSTSGTISGASDNPSYSVTITYYDSQSDALAQNDPMSCPTTSQPTWAVITSTGKPAHQLAGTVPAIRKMQSLVRLTALHADGFTNAVYGESGLSFQNQATITGHVGADADLYTNGNFSCNNNQSYAGTIYSQGSINFTQCSVQGDLYAKNAVTVQNNSSIGGKVLAAGGGATLSSNATVSGTVTASGTVSWTGCTSTKCISNANVPPPPSQPMPQFDQTGPYGTDSTWFENQWAALGYTNYLPTTQWDCNAPGDGQPKDANPTYWILDYASGLSQPTQLHTACAINFSGVKTVKLGSNLAIFANGGFSSTQQATWSSTNSSQTRLLYWIAPFNTALSNNCSAPGISTDQNFGTSNSVNMLLYAQGPINFSNNGTHIGQIYSGCTVTINNNYNLQYDPMPIAGVDPATTPVQGYAVDVGFKREVH